ncbi:MAG: sulfatase [Thermoanaerobaculales bacterium]
MSSRTHWTFAVLVCGIAVVSLGCGDGGLQPDAPDTDRMLQIYDFADRLASARIRKEVAFVDFGEPAAEDVLRAGWSQPEIISDSGTSFVWAAADSASFDTFLLRTDYPGVEFRCWPFAFEGAPSQSVEVRINEQPIGSVELERGAGYYSLRVPEGVLSLGENRIDLVFGYAERPRDRQPGSSDERTLAVAFDSFGFSGARRAADDAGDRASRRDVEARGGDVFLDSGVNLVYTISSEGSLVLGLTPSLEDSPKSGAPGVLIWTRRQDAPAETLLSAKSSGFGGEELSFFIEPGDGPVEIGFAAVPGDTSAAGERRLVLRRPRLFAEEGIGEGSGNLLLIVVDTLRADFVGAYGADVETPTIDALADRGVLFAQARSHIPITGPSHASLFTSLLPMEHGVHNNAQELSERFPTLAESLRAAGRSTAAVISLGVMQRQFGFARGFEHFGDSFPRDWMKNAAEVTDETLASVEASLGEPFFLWVHYSDPHEPYAPPDLDYPRIELRLDGRIFGQIDSGGRGNSFDLELPSGASELEFIPLDVEAGRSYRFDTLRIDDPAIEVEPLGGWRMREKRIGPATFQTELPATLRLVNPSENPVATELLLTCKQLLRKPEIRRRYAGEVEFTDREIGRLLAGLEARGLMDNTLVIFASDHGEGLGNHDHVGHVSQLYDTLLKVPLIFVWPEHLPEGAVVEDPVSLIDVFPTVADLLGLEAPADASGVSLVPLMHGTAIPTHPFVASTYRPESYSDKQAIVMNGFKYIHSKLDDREWETLYDLSTDPEELDDLSEVRPGLLAELRAELKRRMDRVASVEPIEAELSEEEAAHLRALGYVH